MLLNMLLDIPCNHAIAFLEANRGTLDDKRLGHLASIIVGDLDDRAVVDGGVSEEVGFKFGGSDLVALCSC